MSMLLKVNDTVLWSGSFGTAGFKPAKVEAIDINCDGGKEGDEADEVLWNDVTRDNVVVTLDNGHWAYGDQLKPAK